MGSPAIFKGNFTKFLKDQFEMFSNWRLFTSDTDNPNLVAKDARRGSLYFRNDLTNPDMFIKLDDGSTTTWSKINKEAPQVLSHILADETALSSIVTGGNAIFDNGGTFNGTLSKSTIAADLVIGENTFKWVGSATAGDNTNNFVVHSEKNIPQGSRGKHIAILAKVKWDGISDNMEFKVKDTTNSNILTPLGTTGIANFDPADNQALAYSFIVYIPSDCEQIEIGFQCITGEASKTLIWDDFIITEDAFKSFKLSNEQLYSARIANDGATASIIRQEPSFIQSVTRTAVGRVRVNFTAGVFQQNPVAVAAGIDVDATDHQVNVNSVDTTGCNVIFESSNIGTDFDADFGLIVTSQDPLVDSGLIVKNSSALNSEIRLQTGNNFGSGGKILKYATVLNEEGSDLEYLSDATGDFLVAKSKGLYSFRAVNERSAGSAQAGFSKNSTQLATDIRSINFADRYGLVTTSGDTDWTVNAKIPLNAGDRVAVHTNGTNVFGTSTLAEFAGYKIGTTQVTGVPLPRTAYLKDVQVAGTQGGSSVGGGVFQTRVLNTLEGDDGVVSSLAANQFILGKGVYHIEASAPCRSGVNHKIVLRNITDATYDIVGQANQCGSGGNVDKARLAGKIVLDSAKTFEIQHPITAAHATFGLGSANNFGGTVETFTQVKITKVE